MDHILKWAQDRLIRSQTVGRAVEGRIHIAFSQTPPNPVYPMVTLQRYTSGEVDAMAPLEEFTVLITSYSTLSPDEAFDLQTAIKSLLHQQNGQGTTDAFVFTQAYAPVGTYDDTAEPVYVYYSVYRIRHIG